MGQPPSFVGKIENGTRGIDVVEFVAWSKAADTKPQMILTKLLKCWPETSRRQNRSRTIRHEEPLIGMI